MLGMFRKAVREEAAPVARQLAEVRGLVNQANRRLESSAGRARRGTQRRRRRSRRARRAGLGRMEVGRGAPRPHRAEARGRASAPRSRVERRQQELEAAALARGALEAELAAERDRELLGDREAEPGAAPVPRPERRGRSARAPRGSIPGPESETDTATLPLFVPSRARSAPRRASSETRSRAGWR